MPIGQMQQTVSEQEDVQQLQRSLNQQFQGIAKIPFMNGNFVGSVSVNGTATVNTGLGRVAQGYFVTSRSAAAVVWNDAFSGNVSITLHSASAVVVDIWVF